MTRNQLQRIDTICFAIVLTSVTCGLRIGIAGILEQIRAEGGRLWKLLGTCGAVFAAAMTVSMAIAWLKANE